MDTPKNIDVQAGSRTYNRLDMQVSQALHMAIELFEDLNFLLVMDYYDDISIFDDSDNPKSVSYYQMKTSDDTIILSTIISEEWLPKLYSHLNNPEYLIKCLGLITNCPIKLENQMLREEKTFFSNFNEETIKKIKNDISKKMHIDEDDVDLSKFVHIRTTLSILKHKDIAEQELSEMLQKRYPHITVESTKIIFQSIIDMLTKRQKYELLKKNSDFATVKSKKGVSRDDINRTIQMTMLVSIPSFQVIENLIPFTDDDKYKASYEYAKILNDSQKKDEGFYSLLVKIKNIITQFPILKDENYLDYSRRIIRLIPCNPIYNDFYIEILIVSILYNTWIG